MRTNTINQQYADAESNVKDVIKFTTDVVFSEAAFPAAFGSAVRSLVASKTIDSDPIAFATDAALIIRKGTDVRRKLSELAFAEAGATVAADMIVGQLLGPFRKYVGNVADEARASALRAIDKATAELLMLEVIEAGLTPAFEREITRAKAYAARVTPQLDGTWQSVEPNQRFLLQCSSGRCTWRDAHPDYPTPYSVERIFICNPGGAYLLERPNDDEALVAQGIQPTLRAEVLVRRPDPSTLTLSRSGEQLIGHWRALLIVKNANARLKELKYPERDYRFVRK